MFASGAGRLKILQVHTRSIPLGSDVDLGAIGASPPGMVGADLANLCNEAALRAARLGHDKVQLADFTDSLEKILRGPTRDRAQPGGPRANRLSRIRTRAHQTRAPMSETARSPTGRLLHGHRAGPR